MATHPDLVEREWIREVNTPVLRVGRPEPVDCVAQEPSGGALEIARHVRSFTSARGLDHWLPYTRPVQVARV